MTGSVQGNKKADVTEISYIHSRWLVAPKKISPDFLKKPLVARLFYEIVT